MIPFMGRTCESGPIREGVEVRLWPGDQERLEGVIFDRKSPQHHVWRALAVEDHALEPFLVAQPQPDLRERLPL